MNIPIAKIPHSSLANLKTVALTLSIANAILAPHHSIFEAH
jgi:hypothetical protein